MRRTPLIIALILFIILSSQASYASKIGIGDSCKKVGATTKASGAKLVCTKVKSKLVWTKKNSSLPAPIIEVEAGANSGIWNVLIRNSKELKNINFSYSYACNGGAWSLFLVSRNANESVNVNSMCAQIEFKVFFVDDNGTIKNSNYVTKRNKDAVNSVPTPTPSPASSQTATIQLLSLNGVQKLNLPTNYVGDKPFARILFRWPLPNSQNLAGFVVSYQDLTMVAPPCDLTKALCESPRRFDTKIYNIVISDLQQDKIEVANLKPDNQYQFNFCYILGSRDTLSSISSLSCDVGPNQFLNTDTEKVPSAPEGVFVGSVSKAIEIELRGTVSPGHKVVIMVVGGKFGTGSIVGTLTAAGKIKVDADPGDYQVVAWSVTPSGINGSPSTTFTVSVKS